jgi:hypothetical protein
MNIYVVLIGVILAAFSVKHVQRTYVKNQKSIGMLFYIVICVMGFIVIHESMTRDLFWKKVTDISPFEAAYEKLKRDKEIKVVAHYPMMVQGGENGVPFNFIFMAQLFHEKTVVNGIDPFNTESIEFQRKIKSLTHNGVINILRNTGVDMLILHDDLYTQKELLEIKLHLYTDPAISYYGGYQGDFDKVIVIDPKSGRKLISMNEKSRKISMYRIQRKVTNNQDKSNEPLYIEKKSPYLYSIQIPTKRAIDLQIAHPHSWSLYTDVNENQARWAGTNWWISAMSSWNTKQSVTRYIDEEDRLVYARTPILKPNHTYHLVYDLAVIYGLSDMIAKISFGIILLLLFTTYVHEYRKKNI